MATNQNQQNQVLTHCLRHHQRLYQRHLDLANQIRAVGTQVYPLYLQIVNLHQRHPQMRAITLQINRLCEERQWLDDSTTPLINEIIAIGHQLPN